MAETQETQSMIPTEPEPKPQPASTLSFSPEQINGYHRSKRILMLTGIALSLLCWTAWCLLADAWVLWLGESVSNRWPALFLTVFVMLGVNTLIGLPLDFHSSFILEHRFNLSNQTVRDWIVFQVKSWLVAGVIGGGILAALYAALWYTGRFWGVYVWIGVMLFSIVLAKVFPLIILPIFYPAKPLDRPSLSERLKNLAGRANMTITGIFDLGLSKDTKKANAMLAGLGSSRRVYLSDTLLDNFSDEQIAVVFAHELGHHIRGHIFKQIGIAAVTSSLLVTLIWWRLNPYAGDPPAEWTGAVTAFAHVMLITSLFSLLLGPVTNTFSRYFERQADHDALRLTDDPVAFREAFAKLVQVNLADATPPRWEEILFDDHPAIAKRIAMAEEYAHKSI